MRLNFYEFFWPAKFVLVSIIRAFNPFDPDIFLRSARTRKKIDESLSLASCRYNQLRLEYIDEHHFGFV